MCRYTATIKKLSKMLIKLCNCEVGHIDDPVQHLFIESQPLLNVRYQVTTYLAGLWAGAIEHRAKALEKKQSSTCPVYFEATDIFSLRYD